MNNPRHLWGLWCSDCIWVSVLVPIFRLQFCFFVADWIIQTRIAIKNSVGLLNIFDAPSSYRWPYRLTRMESYSGGSMHCLPSTITWEDTLAGPCPWSPTVYKVHCGSRNWQLKVQKRVNWWECTMYWYSCCGPTTFLGCKDMLLTIQYYTIPGQQECNLIGGKWKGVKQ